MRNRRGTDTGFVRECCPLEALDQRPDETAGNTKTGESAFENLTERPADLVVVDQQDDDRGTDIHDAHERNDLFRHFGNRLQTADNHGKNDRRKYQSGDPARIIADNAGNLGMGLIGLEHVPTAKRAQNAENGKQNGEKPAAGQTQFLEALRDVIHRAA